MQAIDLSLEKDYLPVNLKDVDTGEIKETLRFYYDDTTIKTFERDSDIVLKRISEIGETEEAQSEKEDAILKEWFEYVLGVGSYEKIKICQRSIIHRKAMLIDLSFGISKALGILRDQQEEKEADFYTVKK